MVYSTGLPPPTSVLARMKPLTRRSEEVQGFKALDRFSHSTGLIPHTLTLTRVQPLTKRNEEAYQARGRYVVQALEGVHGKSLAVHQDLNHGQPHGLQQKNHKFACSKRITVYQLYRLQQKDLCHGQPHGLQQTNHKFACSKRITVYQLYRMQQKDLCHGQPHGLQLKNYKLACSKRITVYQLYRLQHKKYKGLQQKNRTTTPPREQGVHCINNTTT